MKYSELISKLESFGQDTKYVFVKSGSSSWVITATYKNYVMLTDAFKMSDDDQYIDFCLEQESWTIKDLIKYLSEFDAEVDFGNAMRVGHIDDLYMENGVLHIKIEYSKERKHK